MYKDPKTLQETPGGAWFNKTKTPVPGVTDTPPPEKKASQSEFDAIMNWADDILGDFGKIVELEQDLLDQIQNVA